LVKLGLFPKAAWVELVFSALFHNLRLVSTIQVLDERDVVMVLAAAALLDIMKRLQGLEELVLLESSL
jgi:hypothetical protein